MSKAIRKMLEEGLISRVQFEQATMLKTTVGDTLSYHLVQMGAITDEEIVEFMLKHYATPFYPRDKLMSIDPKAAASVSAKLALKLRVLPIELDEQTLTIGVTDPTRTHATEEIAFHTGLNINTVIVTETDMSFALEHYFSDPLARTAFSPIQIATVSKSVKPLDPVSSAIDSGPLAEVRASSASPISFRPAIKADSRSSQAEKRQKDSEAGQQRLSEGEILFLIHKAKNRYEIIDFSLSYMMHFSDRAAFFIVKQSAIRGFEIKGEFTSQSAIRSYWVPLLAESTFRQVVKERRIHLGPLGRTAADAILSASLGGRPSRILAIPVEIGHRVIGLLYADRLHVAMPPWNKLERIAEVTGTNLARILKAKSNGKDTIQ